MKCLFKRQIFFTMMALLCNMAVFAQADEIWHEGKHKDGDAFRQTITAETYVRIAEKVTPAVVHISTTSVVDSKDRPFHFFHKRWPKQDQDQDPQERLDPFYDFFDRFLDMPDQGRPHRQQGLGSGFIIHEDGYIVTNNHVIDGASEIKVTLNDESEYSAEVIGRDPKTDVALIKINPKKEIPSVVLGDSQELRVGDIVVAIGNPFGLSHTVTQGIVSAKGRTIGFGDYDDFIQTDASINPGNSGGPLLNIEGEVVGINSAIIGSGTGIGFAIPIHLAKTILKQLKTEGKVTRAWLGVYIQKITPDLMKSLKLDSTKGALVAEVVKDGPAAKAGVEISDVIVRFDGKEIREHHDLPFLVASSPVGKQVEIDVYRDGKKKTFEISLDEHPDNDNDGENISRLTGEPQDKLGFEVQKLTPEIAKSLGFDEETKGVIISDVSSDSIAYEKGIRHGDLIVEINKERINTLEDYRRTVKQIKAGDTVLLLLKRPEGSLFIAFELD